jgi:uncharacterized protein YqeY
MPIVLVMTTEPTATQPLTTPPTFVDPSIEPLPLRHRLREALAVAIKGRDRLSTSVLRATLGAIENAEAVPADVAAAGGPGSLAIEWSPVGVGAAEVARRVLTEDDVHVIVRAELAEREQAADTYLGAGRPEQAERLRAEIEVLAAFV